MADFTFDCTKERLYEAAAMRACRNAVVWPLAARASDEGKPRLKPEVAYARVLAAWRGRLLALRKAKWRPLNTSEFRSGAHGKRLRPQDVDHTNLQYMRNCPPVGIRPPAKLASFARQCRRARVCPWCYGREVILEACKAIEYACFAAIGRKNLGRYKLVALRKPVVASVAAHSIDKLTKNEGVALGVDAKRYADHGCKVHGAYTSTAIGPAQNPPDHMGQRRSAILLLDLPADEPLPSKDMARRELPGAQITAEAIGQLVAWCFPYPRGMLFGDPGWAVALLHDLAKKRSKQVRATGLFRNAHARSMLWTRRRAVGEVEDGSVLTTKRRVGRAAEADLRPELLDVVDEFAE